MTVDVKERLKEMIERLRVDRDGAVFNLNMKTQSLNACAEGERKALAYANVVTGALQMAEQVLSWLPDDLTPEMTEQIAIPSLERLNKRLQEIREQGETIK